MRHDYHQNVGRAIAIGTGDLGQARFQRRMLAAGREVLHHPRHNTCADAASLALSRQTLRSSLVEEMKATGRVLGLGVSYSRKSTVVGLLSKGSRWQKPQKREAGSA